MILFFSNFLAAVFTDTYGDVTQVYTKTTQRERRKGRTSLRHFPKPTFFPYLTNQRGEYMKPQNQRRVDGKGGGNTFERLTWFSISITCVYNKFIDNIPCYLYNFHEY